MIEMFMRFPGVKDKALTLSYDDGAQAYQSLQSSADGKRLHNPTAITLYYCVNNGR